MVGVNGETMHALFFGAVSLAKTTVGAGHNTPPANIAALRPLRRHCMELLFLTERSIFFVNRISG
jgi:hypothetical protein